MLVADIQFKRFRTQLKLSRKFSILQGLSGTGKTYLSEQLSLLEEPVLFSDGVARTIFVAEALATSRVSKVIQQVSNCVFVIDEDSALLYDEGVLCDIYNSPNYFIIIAREKFSMLPYGIDDIFILTGKFNDSRMELRFPRSELFSHGIQQANFVVCEGSGLDYALVQKKLEGTVVQVLSSSGKSRVLPVTKDLSGRTAVVVDWCGAGADTAAIAEAIISERVSAVQSDSFECELLNSEALLGSKAGVDSPPLTNNLEEYYTQQLDERLSRLYGINYSKSSSGLCSGLILNGFAKHGGAVIRAVSGGKYSIDSVYSELNKLNPGYESSAGFSVPRMTFE